MINKIKLMYKKWFESDEEYVNSYYIDTYVDNYWFMNCTKNQNVKENRLAVFNLLKTIIMQKYDEETSDLEIQPKKDNFPKKQQNLHMKK